MKNSVTVQKKDGLILACGSSKKNVSFEVTSNEKDVDTSHPEKNYVEKSDIGEQNVVKNTLERCEVVEIFSDTCICIVGEKDEDFVDTLEFGDFAEAKSFAEGFRGAWFKVEILDSDNGAHEEAEIHLSLEKRRRYFVKWVGYPGEKKTWINLFDADPAKPDGEMERLLRPLPPIQITKSEWDSEEFPIEDLLIVRRDDWRKGDQVDVNWEGCWWIGKIERLLKWRNQPAAKIEYMEYPKGERNRPGAVWKKGWSLIELKNLRASVIWENNEWHIPTPLENCTTLACIKELRSLSEF